MKTKETEGNNVINEGQLTYKFENLKVWKLSLELNDIIYKIADQLPDNEKNNLKIQILRAATSVCLNITEGSTGLSNKEQARFLAKSLRSLVETIACVQLIIRRKYLISTGNDIMKFNEHANQLFVKLNSFIK